MDSRPRCSAVAAALLALAAAAPSTATGAEPFTTGVVSITFDDGGSTEYSLAYPILERYGMKATFYVIPAAIGANAGFMTIAQLQDLAAHGHEIGSHTFNHLDLTTLSDAQVMDELSSSKAWIVQNVGVADVTSFASPYGGDDDRVRALIANVYASHRSVDPGLNFRDSDPYKLLAYGDSYAKWYVDQAKNERGWLIIVLHNLTEDPNDTTATQVSDFVALLDQVKASGMAVLPVDQARALMSAPPPPPPPPRHPRRLHLHLHRHRRPRPAASRSPRAW